MRRRHEMPFGATIQDDRSVRFRLWAPSTHCVELKINAGGAGQRFPMKEVGDGWFEVVTDAARAGSRYMYVVNGDTAVPDPASRDQAGDVHGWSVVVDPTEFDWQDESWRGRPWHEAVLYELHVGTFSRAGSYGGVQQHLDDLVQLGVSAIELMPLAEAPGRHNWGYDGVYLFAPGAGYGRPNDLKLLIEAAHRRGLMVFIDVVYNHFGPEGNYLPLYASPFFTERHHTPWGAAINYDGNQSRAVRDFMIHNALYWLEEYNADGLRLDAVHAIIDDSKPHILTELAQTVRARIQDRAVHLVLENDNNAASLLGAGAAAYDAQWNDDLHHALHTVVTGDDDGYYVDYADARLRHLGRALTEGFAYQGEASVHREGKRRGEPSAALPPTRFVGFLQNHDQVGNHALGERITHEASEAAVRAAVAIYLLAPSPPLLFMGEEWATSSCFPFFCDFGPELADKVREGRRLEFTRFAEFRDPAARERIPDPAAPETFHAAVLDWSERAQGSHAAWLAFYRTLLGIRRREIIPRLKGIEGHAGSFTLGDGSLRASWRLGDGADLVLDGQLCDRPAPVTKANGEARILFATHPDDAMAEPRRMPAWSVVWSIGGHGS